MLRSEPPSHLSRISGVRISRKSAPISLASARDNMVLPVPGGPYIRMPCGRRAPHRAIASGCRNDTAIWRSSATIVGEAADLVEGDGLRGGRHLGHAVAADHVPAAGQAVRPGQLDHRLQGETGEGLQVGGRDVVARHLGAQPHDGAGLVVGHGGLQTHDGVGEGAGFAGSAPAARPGQDRVSCTRPRPPPRPRRRSGWPPGHRPRCAWRAAGRPGRCRAPARGCVPWRAGRRRC